MMCTALSLGCSLQVNGTKHGVVSRGTPAVTQVGGTLIMSMNEFTGSSGVLHRTQHLEVGPAAAKTIFTQNIVKGVLGVNRKNGDRPKAKYIVRDNADDS